MKTRIDTLWQHSTERPNSPAFSSGPIEGTDNKPRRQWTFADLANNARSMAVALTSSGVNPGDRVIIALPNSLEYIAALYGCIAAGAISVPLFPPGSGKHRDRFTSVIVESQPAAVIVTEKHLIDTGEVLQSLQVTNCATVVATEALEAERAAEWTEQPVNEIAWLQYTSGSTSAPKGVMVTHDNLVANSDSIGRAFGHHEGSTGVSWLPLFHDMGLVGSIVHAVEWGQPCHLMDPAEFLRKPADWLRAISLLGADTSGGPNFGYDWCVDKVKDSQLEGVDLSGWRIAYNGSEAVSAATLDRFAERFAEYGFDRGSFTPCYGLAEHTLLVSGGPLRDSEMMQTFDRAAFTGGHVAPIADGPKALTLVASGQVDKDNEVRIVGPEGELLPERTIGEILVDGPSLTAGYWRHAKATAEAYGTAPGCHNPGFLRTGDLGFMTDGLLFVTGRAKELIVVRGSNLYPHDVEQVAIETVDQKGGSAAAFAVPGDSSEELAICVEVAKSLEDAPAMARKVRLRIAQRTGVQARYVALIPKRGVLKTSSGKIRRTEMSTQFQDGTLETVFIDEFAGPSKITPRPDLEVAYRAPSGATEKSVTAVWVKVLGITGIGADDDFLHLGGTSLTAVQIALELGKTFGIDFELSDVFETHTVAQVSVRIEEIMNAQALEDEELVEIEL